MPSRERFHPPVRDDLSARCDLCGHCARGIMHVRTHRFNKILLSRKRCKPPFCSRRLKRYLTNDRNNNICHRKLVFRSRFFFPLALSRPSVFYRGLFSLLADVYNVISPVVKGLAALMATISRFGHGVPRISLELIGRHRWLPETLYNGAFTSCESLVLNSSYSRS